jgi:curli biogenesis system outer membrane secretion channel CsgG
MTYSLRPDLHRLQTAIAALCLLPLLISCSTSTTRSGGQSDMALTNDNVIERAPDAGGLARCKQSIGSTAITEADTNAQALTSAGLPRSMAPLVRHMLSRTGCFVVVDRGAAFTLLEQERKLRAQQGSDAGAAGGELRTADYVMRAEIVFAEQTDGARGLLGAMFGNVIGGVGGQYAKKEAVVLLSVVDARTSEIVSSVFGRGTSESAGLGSAVIGSGGALLEGGWADTPQAKTVAAALVDSWNRTLQRLPAKKPAPPEPPTPPAPPSPPAPPAPPAPAPPAPEGAASAPPG